jgi:hypothetical protein
MIKGRRKMSSCKCKEDGRREGRREGRSRCGYLDVRGGPEPAVALLIGWSMLSAPLVASGINSGRSPANSIFAEP